MERIINLFGVEPGTGKITNILNLPGVHHGAGESNDI